MYLVLPKCRCGRFRQIFPIDATKTDIKFEIPTIENPRINILHNSFGMRHSPLACSPPWSHI